MIRILKGAARVKTPLFLFSADKQQTYIPIRPLKDERNVLFSAGAPSSLSLSAKVLIYTPFLAVSLDGVINEWTNWRIFGSLFLLWAGLRVVRYVNFVKAQQVFALKTNKDLSRFFLTLPNNRFAAKFQEILLDNEKRTFEQKFKQNLKDRTLEIPEEIYSQLNAASESQLSNHIAFLKSVRQGVVLQLHRKDIQKFQFVSEREMRKVLRRDLLQYLARRKEKEVLEEYSALKQQRNFVLITTKPFKKWNDRPMHFYLNFASNSDKKYEEYIRALAEGKKIIEP